MSEEEARAFADDWIAAWNAHDVDRVLAHYSEDVVFFSPIARQRVGDGRVEGRDALRSYWNGALSGIPDLAFTLEDVLLGHHCLTIIYRNHRRQRVAETFEFGGDRKVVRASACYGSASET